MGAIVRTVQRLARSDRLACGFHRVALLDASLAMAGSRIPITRIGAAAA